MTSNKKLKQLNTAKKLIFITLVIYITAFFVINSSYLTLDNIHRFLFSLSQSISGDIPDSDIIDFEESVKNRYGIYKNGFAVLNQKTLSIYNDDNCLISEHNMNFTNPILRVSDKYIACFERGGTTLNILDSFNFLQKMDFPEGIINVTINNDGYISVITNCFGYKGMITIFNDRFEKIYIWQCSDSYLMDIVFLESNSVSVISLSQETENTNILVRNINYKTGEESNICTISDNFPIGIKNKVDKSVEIFTDVSIISVKNAESKIIYKDINEQIDIFFQESDNSIISRIIDTATRKYEVEAISSTGKVLFTLEFSDVKSIYCFNNAFYILSGERLHILDNYGIIVQTIEVSPGANQVIADKEIAYVLGANYAQKIDLSFIY